MKFSQLIQLGQITVGHGRPPMIVAEMSGNHNMQLDRALKIVEEAKKSGAHALKIQTYTADTMTLDSKLDGFVIKDKDSLWFGKSLYELYQEAHTPWEWHEPIYKRCQELGIECFSSPFDSTAVQFLEELGMPFYKIASFENRDLELIRAVAETGKPVIVSTGMASEEEIADVLEMMKQAKNPNLVLLKCTSSYPSDPTQSNLRTIIDMKNRFGCQVGLSDHTLGISVALASVSLGTSVIEKHFTLSRKDGGVDSAFSLEPHELKALVDGASQVFDALGKVHYGPTANEESSLQFRRSLYFVKDLKQGEVVLEEHIRSIRPGHGLPPKVKKQIVGVKTSRDVVKGTPVLWDYLKP